MLFTYPASPARYASVSDGGEIAGGVSRHSGFNPESSVLNWYGEDANKRLWIPAVAGMAALRAGNSQSRSDGAFNAGDAG